MGTPSEVALRAILLRECMFLPDFSPMKMVLRGPDLWDARLIGLKIDLRLKRYAEQTYLLVRDSQLG